eukprot:1138933-Pelagomonas_calceolata.AAC.6
MPPGGAQKPSGMAGGPFGSLKEPSAASAAAAAADDAVAGSSCRGRLLLHKTTTRPDGHVSVVFDNKGSDASKVADPMGD